MKTRNLAFFAVMILILLLLAGCAPSHEMYDAEPAGFWAGLWHGLILLITFIINLFTDSVGIYEVKNTGAWYNFGFLLGIMISFGHGGLWSPVRKSFCSGGRDKDDWEEIARKVEKKVRNNIKDWAEESDDEDKEWEDIGKKVEEKIKREIKNWAEK